MWRCECRDLCGINQLLIWVCSFLASYNFKEYTSSLRIITSHWYIDNPILASSFLFEEGKDLALLAQSSRIRLYMNESFWIFYGSILEHILICYNYHICLCQPLLKQSKCNPNSQSKDSCTKSFYWIFVLKFAIEIHQMHYHKWKILFSMGVHADQKRNLPYPKTKDIF